ncbi:major facilitator superfamily domain-containing protein [Truncatella angustata]|uniref:Major facilitator superfamily domain-containing protein n=1 Tax=Truncatella angustata TaxID=152316 RepID=A0A9P8UI05_9PEZI|nr:major facilitator superfamily domain-containing protein [Truncatella angustata]KAH6652491.1 major facilitator superfamily domain-containing protein [Truncatella angustata]
MAAALENAVFGLPHPLDEKVVSEDVTAESSLRSHDTAADVYHLDAKGDRVLTTKIDFKVIPIMGLLYLVCFLDRTNIANARLAGLEKDLNMPSTGFNTALWMFYIPFVLFEVPSNWIMGLHWIKPNLFLGAQMLILGVLAMCQGFTHSYEGLLAIRFLLGIVETGLPAGAGLLIASYYRKKELSLRFALFFSFGQLGACFSGLLAYALMSLDGTANLAGWSWIFVVEGLITVVFSVFVFIFTPHFPAQDKWLSKEDQSQLLARLQCDKGEEKQRLAGRVNWKKIIFDYKIWLLTLLFFCADMSAGSLSSFNPTILSQLGWTERRAQVMTIPVWIVGIVGALTTTFFSGRLNMRWPFIIPAILLSVVGWILHLLQVNPPGVRYFAQFLIGLGTFVCMPLYIGMLTANLRGRASQSFGTAIVLGIGNCANFISSNVFITTQLPRYPVGFGTGLGITALSLPVMLFTMAIFNYHNKRIDRKIAALQPGDVLDDQVDYKLVY